MRTAPLALLLAAPALAGPTHAQDRSVQRNEISAAGRGGANVSGGDGGTAATSGGGGPSGVTGYVARLSPTATKTDTPLIEAPQSVPVVTRGQLNDRNVQRRP
ncbi:MULTISPECIES: hypothetical protein [unclassified Methylobacterium]|uniref:hypothetical protein n=1 Tax=unclassified Methylobacterium TaxID=2615210 RepID=UPI00314566CB